MWSTFRARDLLRIARRVDRVAKEKRADARIPPPEDRLARAEARNRSLRVALRRTRR